MIQTKIISMQGQGNLPIPQPVLRTFYAPVPMIGYAPFLLPPGPQPYPVPQMMLPVPINQPQTALPQPTQVTTPPPANIKRQEPEPKPRIRHNKPAARSKKHVSQSDRQRELTRVYCKCTKNGCLKEYCRCFKLGVECSDACSCVNCRNNDPDLLEKQKSSMKDVRCNCRKTKCLSKYCDCLAYNQKCGEKCGCLDCENKAIQ